MWTFSIKRRYAGIDSKYIVYPKCDEVTYKSLQGKLQYDNIFYPVCYIKISARTS